MAAARERMTDVGRHDFDFFFGTWQQRNRKRVRPLVRGDEAPVREQSGKLFADLHIIGPVTAADGLTREVGLNGVTGLGAR